MFENNIDCEDVVTALKKTSKGRLSYDRHWKEERRTQEIINDIKLKTSSLIISPKSLLNQNNTNEVNKSKSCAKYKVIESSKDVTKISNNSQQNESNINNKRDKSLLNNSLSHLNDSVSDYDLIVYEKQRQESVAQELNKKKQILETEFKKCEEEFDEEMKLIRQKWALDAIKKINSFADDYKALKESIFTKQLSFEDNSMTTNSKLKEIESKHQLLVEEQHKKQTDLRRKQIIIIRNECDSVLKSCLHLANELELKSDQYFHTLKQDSNSMMALIQTIDVILNKSDFSDSDINSAQNLKLQINELKNKIMSDINVLKQNSIKTNVSQNITQNTKTDNTSNQSSNCVSNFVDTNAFKEYLRLQKYFNDFENSFKAFITENEFKKKRNELQLFVKTTINTISCESVEHIRDKLNRLTQLFSEKYVEYGGKQIKCNSKDGSLPFCISLTSKMFISVSTKQKDIALTMAPIVVLLWSRFPIFGQIFMAQMQDKCPYLVPYYPERDSAESEDNYLIACGYTISKDGTQESEETFLNRMRALIKLYAAIIQSNIESGHPQGLKYGWNWMARLLNLEPRPAITAAVLEAFLSLTSHKFYRFYGKQFIKIIDFIQNDYIKRIESVSIKGTKRQSLVKLQMFIEELKRKIDRRVDYKQLKPEGLIPDYFFHSSYSHSRGFASNN